jgi:hypothetical protein
LGLENPRGEILWRIGIRRPDRGSRIRDKVWLFVVLTQSCYRIQKLSPMAN